MKQITFKKAFAIIFICALCASYFLLKEGKQNFSDLTFSNIEALASGESGSKDCYMAGSLSCNGGWDPKKWYRQIASGLSPRILSGRSMRTKCEQPGGRLNKI